MRYENEQRRCKNEQRRFKNELIILNICDKNMQN